MCHSFSKLGKLQWAAFLGVAQFLFTGVDSQITQDTFGSKSHNNVTRKAVQYLRRTAKPPLPYRILSQRKGDVSPSWHGVQMDFISGRYDSRNTEIQIAVGETRRLAVLELSKDSLIASFPLASFPLVPFPLASFPLASFPLPGQGVCSKL